MMDACAEVYITKDYSVELSEDDIKSIARSLLSLERANLAREMLSIPISSIGGRLARFWSVI